MEVKYIEKKSIKTLWVPSEAKLYDAYGLGTNFMTDEPLTFTNDLPLEDDFIDKTGGLSESRSLQPQETKVLIKDVLLNNPLNDDTATKQIDAIVRNMDPAKLLREYQIELSRHERFNQTRKAQTSSPTVRRRIQSDFDKWKKESEPTAPNIEQKIKRHIKTLESRQASLNQCDQLKDGTISAKAAEVKKHLGATIEALKKSKVGIVVPAPKAGR